MNRNLWLSLGLMLVSIIGCGAAEMPVCTGGLCGKTVESGRAAYVAPEKVAEVMTVPVAGKVTVIDFWDRDCPPCKEAMPRWNALSARMDPAMAIMIGVSLDSKIDEARAAVREDSRLHVSFPMLHDGEALILDGIYEVGVKRPVTVVVDANGTIIYDSRGSNGDAVKEVEAVLLSMEVL